MLPRQANGLSAWRLSTLSLNESLRLERIRENADYLENLAGRRKNALHEIYHIADKWDGSLETIYSTLNMIRAIAKEAMK